MRKSGFNPHDIEVLESDFHANGDEIKIIKTSSNKQEIVLVYMVKNKIGFWSVGYWSPYLYTDEEPEEKQLVSIA